MITVSSTVSHSCEAAEKGITPAPMPTDSASSVPISVTGGLGKISPGARANTCDVEKFSRSPGICASCTFANDVPPTASKSV